MQVGKESKVPTALELSWTVVKSEVHARGVSRFFFLFYACFQEFGSEGKKL